MAISEATHWRDSARTAKFFVIDASAAFPFLLFLLHIQLWSFIVAFIAMLFFTLLRRWGFTVPLFARWLRTTLAGPHKQAMFWWKE